MVDPSATRYVHLQLANQVVECEKKEGNSTSYLINNERQNLISEVESRRDMCVGFVSRADFTQRVACGENILH